MIRSERPGQLAKIIGGTADYTTIGATLTWQYNDLHQLKSGIETRQYDIGEFSASGVGGGFFGNSSDASFIMWNHRPRSSSWYIQDKTT